MTTGAPSAVASTGYRSPLRAVAVPTEHGGWGLTAEPVLLGLAIAPSVAGVCIGIAAVVGFLARTPLRVVLVDRHRHRDLDRTGLARRVLFVEVAAIVMLAGVAAVTATGTWGGGGPPPSPRLSSGSSCGSTLDRAADACSPNSPAPSASARWPR